MSDAYKAVEFHQADCYGPGVLGRSGQLAAETAKNHGQPDLQKQIIRAAGRSKASLVSTLLLTCKSHKAVGQVEFRSIHASRCHALEGLSRWASRVFDEWLQQHPWPLHNAEDVVARLSNLRLFLGEAVVCIDARHFFSR